MVLASRRLLSCLLLELDWVRDEDEEDMSAETGFGI
jgi:hypothetical protein